MKKTILLASLFLMWVGMASAQKYACVDTEYILSSIPDYEQAQKSLDKLSIDWHITQDFLICTYKEHTYIIMVAMLYGVKRQVACLLCAVDIG